MFVRDLSRVTTRRVSLSSDGRQLDEFSSAGGISDDGRVVTFMSLSPDVVASDHNRVQDVFARNLATGKTYIVSVGPNEESSNGMSCGGGISGDGRIKTFPLRLPISALRAAAATARPATHIRPTAGRRSAHHSRSRTGRRIRGSRLPRRLD